MSGGLDLARHRRGHADLLAAYLLVPGIVALLGLGLVHLLGALPLCALVREGLGAAFWPLAGLAAGAVWCGAWAGSALGMAWGLGFALAALGFAVWQQQGREAYAWNSLPALLAAWAVLVGLRSLRLLAARLRERGRQRDASPPPPTPSSR